MVCMSSYFNVVAFASCFATSAAAADIGQIKVSKGSVTVERAAQSLPGVIGTRLQASDVITTGANGSSSCRPFTFSKSTAIDIPRDNVRTL